MDVIMFLLLKERWTAYFHELDLIMFIEITWVRKAKKHSRWPFIRLQIIWIVLYQYTG